jgi:hypothetical protein
MDGFHDLFLNLGPVNRAGISQTTRCAECGEVGLLHRGRDLFFHVLPDVTPDAVNLPLLCGLRAPDVLVEEIDLLLKVTLPKGSILRRRDRCKE